MITTLKLVLAILSVILIILPFLLHSTNNSLDGIFTTGNITQSKKESFSENISAITMWIIVILWAITGVTLALLLK